MLPRFLPPTDWPRALDDSVVQLQTLSLHSLVYLSGCLKQAQDEANQPHRQSAPEVTAKFLLGLQETLKPAQIPTSTQRTLTTASEAQPRNSSPAKCNLPLAGARPKIDRPETQQDSPPKSSIEPFSKPNPLTPTLSAPKSFSKTPIASEKRPSPSNQNRIDKLLQEMDSGYRSKEKSAEILRSLSSLLEFDTTGCVAARLSAAYSSGEDGLAKDPKKAEDLRIKALPMLLKSQKAKNPVAMTDLGIFYEEGHTILFQEKGEAARLFKMASDLSYVRAHMRLARMYVTGEGVERNLEKAVNLLRKASDAGHAVAQFNLGEMLKNGEGVKEDPKGAIEMYEMSANQEYPLALAKLGWVHDIGYGGVITSPTRALQYYKRAALLGDVTSQYNAGLMYQYGEGTEKNEKQALVWYKFAGVTLPQAFLNNSNERTHKGQGGLGVLAKKLRSFSNRKKTKDPRPSCDRRTPTLRRF